MRKNLQNCLGTCACAVMCTYDVSTCTCIYICIYVSVCFTVFFFFTILFLQVDVSELSFFDREDDNAALTWKKT